MSQYRDLTGEIKRLINASATNLNTKIQNLNNSIVPLITDDLTLINFRENDLIKLAIGFVKDSTNTFTEPGIAFGAGDETGNNRAIIDKDTNSLNLYYIGNLALREVAGLAIYKDKIETTVPITINKGLATEFILDYINWNKKLEEATAKAILEDSGKAWNIATANLNNTDVANWNAGGAEAGLGLHYYNLMNTDLNKNAALPTSISMGNFGIKATTATSTSYAQLDYRGLYVNEGAIQVKNSSGNTIIDANGVKADYLYGNNITTYSWNANGGTNNYQIMNKQFHNFIEGSSNLVKMTQGFVLNNNGVSYPGIVLGAGAGNDSTVNKGYIDKDTNGLNLFYINLSNQAHGITIKSDGIYCTSELKLSTSLSQTYVQQSGWLSNLTKKLDSNGNFGVNQTGKKVEITDTLISKNASGFNQGIYVDPAYADMYLYNNGNEIFKVYNGLDYTSLYLQQNSIGYGNVDTFYPEGNWDFTGATVTNLSGAEFTSVSGTPALGGDLQGTPTYGDGWNGPSPYTHTIGNTDVISFPITGNIVAGDYVEVVFNFTGSNDFIIYLTDGTNSQLLNYYYDTWGEYCTCGVRADSNYTSLEIYPDVNFNGTFELVHIKKYISQNDKVISLNGLNVIVPNNSSIYIGNGGKIDTESNNNTAFGYQSLLSNTIGQCNTAFGVDALYSNASGYANIAMGYASLYNNYNGDLNIAIGQASLYNNNNGFGNIAVGSESLCDNESGYSNIAIGNGALHRNISGNSNIAIGQNAGRYTSNFNDNNETSSECIYIGQYTGALADGDTNEIVIGSGVTGYGSNTAHVGNSDLTSISYGAGTGTAFTNRSDRRIKEDIVDANLDICYNDIKKLPLHRFKYKDFVQNKGDKHLTGFIADEFEKLFPKAVFKNNYSFPVLDENGNKIIKSITEKDKRGKEITREVEESFIIEQCASIDTSQLVPTLLGAVQKLMEKVEFIENKIKLENGGK